MQLSKWQTEDNGSLYSNLWNKPKHIHSGAKKIFCLCELFITKCQTLPTASSAKLIVQPDSVISTSVKINEFSWRENVRLVSEGLILTARETRVSWEKPSSQVEVDWS